MLASACSDLLALLSSARGQMPTDFPKFGFLFTLLQVNSMRLSLITALRSERQKHRHRMTSLCDMMLSFVPSSETCGKMAPIHSKI